ncbi:hypothetical protein NIES2100_35050 [Calothrix sp. NIES-2100]|uniref:hypothetical protein n=1 Tax=Calothrix sp. NIES-2100 TaxID=1954172 RepID=UPI000B61A398|nr:hypothetical protein NIES2100_35050 [Calothrix sp. NIES-2100]
MPNNNNITITLNAKDAASGVINNLNKSLEGATFRAQLLSQTLFAGVSAGLSALNAKFKEAADLQLNNITAASTYAALTGRSFKDSERVFAVLDERLNKIAAALPGSTQAYKDLALGIQDNLVPAFVDANGVLNEGAFLDGLTEITRGMGFLAAASNVASKDVSKFTAKFLGGSSISELRQLIFAESNPAFLSLVEKRLAESGKKLEQLTVKERTEILKAVQSQLVTPETINAASNSVSGLLESLKDKLFNPSQGIFGLLRDLDEKTAGNQSVLSAFNDTLRALIGNDGLFATIGRALNLIGIKDTSFLEGLRGGIQNLTVWINNLNTFLQGILSSGSLDNILGSINFTDIGSSLSNFINSAVKALLDINYQGAIKYAQQSISTFLSGFKIDTSQLSQLLTKIIDALNSIDWSTLFKGIGAVLAVITNIVLDVISKIDWGNLIGALLDGLGAFLLLLDWGKLSVEILKVVGAAILAGLAGLLIAAGLFFAGVPTAAIGTLTAGIAALIVGLIAVFRAKWNDITKAFNDLFAFIAEGITNLWKDVVTVWNNLTKLFNEFFAFMVEGVTNLWKDVVTIWNNVVSSVLGFFNGIQGYFNNLLSKIPGYNPSTNTANSGLSSAQTLVPNAASGMSSGLLASLARERRNAPPGSGLVVANTSEAILTQRQQANLLNNLGGRGGLNIGNIIIYSQATDAEELVNDMFKHLEQRFLKYSQTHFSTATT